MGIGRFAFTPILPMMTAHAGLTPQGGATLATANYVGYLAGALAATASPRAARSPVVLRASLITLVITLLAMPLPDSPIQWTVLRLLAGFTSALVFVGAVNLMMDQLRHHSPHLAGWGFSGIGIGIAASGLVVFALPANADWRSAWWAVGVLAAVLAAGAWATRHGETAAKMEVANPTPSQQNSGRRRFAVLMACYTLEGNGYIIAGTFLVAAIEQTTPGWLGNGAWIVVGVAAAPSAALWAWLSGHFTHPPLLAGALLLQAVGIALPAVASGPAAALAGAILFGVTFVGVSTIALAAGAHLNVPRAVALLTAGYSAGQIAGPLLAAPLLHHGFQTVLIAGAGVVVCAAAVAALLWIGYPGQEQWVSGADRPPGPTTHRRQDPRPRRRR
ncbi:MAG: YbfB/YjiJ family MFS transporter [Mycobacterium sp.]